jgi:hypothetical protein
MGLGCDCTLIADGVPWRLTRNSEGVSNGLGLEAKHIITQHICSCAFFLGHTHILFATHVFSFVFGDTQKKVSGGKKMMQGFIYALYNCAEPWAFTYPYN